MADATTAHYEISVRGVLGGALLGAFPALMSEVVEGATVLSGCALDQSALHGVLNRIEQLGLELLAVRRVA
jgi:hypothetical protein